MIKANGWDVTATGAVDGPITQAGMDYENTLRRIITRLEETNNALAAQARTWEDAAKAATQQNAILRGKVDELTARVKELDYDWSQMVYEVGHTSEEAEHLREKNLDLEAELTRLRAVEAAAREFSRAKVDWAAEMSASFIRDEDGDDVSIIDVLSAEHNLRKALAAAQGAKEGE